jgi:hypothetical protein
MTLKNRCHLQFQQKEELKTASDVLVLLAGTRTGSCHCRGAQGLPDLCQDETEGLRGGRDCVIRCRPARHSYTAGGAGCCAAAECQPRRPWHPGAAACKSLDINQTPATMWTACSICGYYSFLTATDDHSLKKASDMSCRTTNLSTLPLSPCLLHSRAVTTEPTPPL